MGITVNPPPDGIYKKSKKKISWWKRIFFSEGKEERFKMKSIPWAEPKKKKKKLIFNPLSTTPQEFKPRPPPIKKMK